MWRLISRVEETRTGRQERGVVEGGREGVAIDRKTNEQIDINNIEIKW